MNITPFQPPQTRQEFEKNLHQLQESVQNQTIQFPHDMDMNGLLRVTLLPNQRIDLLTIDESTRLIANMMNQMPMFNEMPSLPKEGDDS